MIFVVDQMGDTVHLDAPPRRIISLVPSQTELLYDLGLESEIVGVTKFCVHPDSARKTKTIIGGTKRFDLDLIKALKPDLVIGNKEENYPEGIDAIRNICPVWMSDVITLDDAFEMIQGLSVLTGKGEEGKIILKEINASFAEFRAVVPRRVLYLMWYDPWMGAANNTFIHAILQRIGLVNVLAYQKRYPELTREEIQQLNPDLVLLSSEPFPFAERHISEIKAIAPAATANLVDGEMFSWYGSRLRVAPAYFSSMIR